MKKYSRISAHIFNSDTGCEWVVSVTCGRGSWVAPGICMEKVANTRIRLLSLVHHRCESNKMDHRKTGY